MKKTGLLLLLILLVSVGFSQKSWTRTKIDDIVSVEMPVVPEKKEAQGMIIYTGKGADSISYAVNIIDFASFGMDSAMLQSMVKQEMFMEQFKGGITQQTKGAEIKDSKIVTVGAYTAYDILIEFENEGKKMITYSFNLFIGSKDYSFVIAALSGVDISAQKEKFVKSIQAK
jgi:hypothetical protein